MRLRNLLRRTPRLEQVDPVFLESLKAFPAETGEDTNIRRVFDSINRLSQKQLHKIFDYFEDSARGIFRKSPSTWDFEENQIAIHFGDKEYFNFSFVIYEPDPQNTSCITVRRSDDSYRCGIKFSRKSIHALRKGRGVPGEEIIVDGSTAEKNLDKVDLGESLRGELSLPSFITEILFRDRNYLDAVTKHYTGLGESTRVEDMKDHVRENVKKSLSQFEAWGSIDERPDGRVEVYIPTIESRTIALSLDGSKGHGAGVTGGYLGIQGNVGNMHLHPLSGLKEIERLRSVSSIERLLSVSSTDVSKIAAQGSPEVVLVRHPDDRVGFVGRIYSPKEDADLTTCASELRGLYQKRDEGLSDRDWIEHKRQTIHRSFNQAGIQVVKRGRRYYVKEL